MKLNSYLLREYIIPLLDGMDDITLMILGYQALVRVCDHNRYELDEDGKVAHPCSVSCPINHTIHCTGLCDLEDIIHQMIKENNND